MSCSSLRMAGCVTTLDSPFGLVLYQILSEPDTVFLSPFRNCRAEFGKIISMLCEVCPTGSLDLTKIFMKLLLACMKGTTSTSTTTHKSNGLSIENDTEMNGGGGGGLNVLQNNELVEAMRGLQLSSSQINEDTESVIALATLKTAYELAVAWTSFMTYLPPTRVLQALPQSAIIPLGYASLLGK